MRKTFKKILFSEFTKSFDSKLD